MFSGHLWHSLLLGDVLSLNVPRGHSEMYSVATFIPVPLALQRAFLVTVGSFSETWPATAHSWFKDTRHYADHNVVTTLGTNSVTRGSRRNTMSDCNEISLTCERLFVHDRTSHTHRDTWTLAGSSQGRSRSGSCRSCWYTADDTSECRWGIRQNLHTVANTHQQWLQDSRLLIIS